MNVAETMIRLHAEGVRMNNCHLAEMMSRYGWELPCFFLQEDVPVIIHYGKWAEFSPFEIQRNNGDYIISKNGEFFTDISIPPMPTFLERKTSDGIPMYKIGELIFCGNFSTLVNQECIFWKTGTQCSFCGVGTRSFQKVKTPQQIVETVQTCMEEGGDIMKRVTLTTGWQPGPDAGVIELASVAKAIKEQCDVPVCVDVPPPSEEKYLELLADAGADAIEINIECFDPSVRVKALPGKGRVSIDRYTRAWKKSLELFGENQVVSIIMAGLGESDASIFEGAEYIASLGVIPFLTPCHPTRGSVMDGKRPPSAERMTKLYQGVVDILKEYGLDPFKTRAGMVTGGGESALKEVMRFGIEA